MAEIVPRFGRGQSSRSFRNFSPRIVRREIRSRSSPPAIRPHDRGIDEMIRVQAAKGRRLAGTTLGAFSPSAGSGGAELPRVAWACQHPAQHGGEVRCSVQPYGSKGTYDYDSATCGTGKRACRPYGQAPRAPAGPERSAALEVRDMGRARHARVPCACQRRQSVRIWCARDHPGAATNRSCLSASMTAHRSRSRKSGVGCPPTRNVVSDALIEVALGVE